VVEVSYASVDSAIPALLQAVTTALREYPLLNAAVGANGLTVFSHVDPAVTISAPTSASTQPSPKTGTIAITLVGTPGIVLSQPLPQPPLVASMSVCQPAKAVIVDQETGGMAIRARGTIALTWNAAAADSAYAIAFLNRVAQLTV
jgi:pyruvate/2-oxoglutarate dehydrogenase complex dihydrolipoamide acyltransferase (E2) component